MKLFGVCGGVSAVVHQRPVADQSVTEEQPVLVFPALVLAEGEETEDDVDVRLLSAEYAKRHKFLGYIKFKNKSPLAGTVTLTPAGEAFLVGPGQSLVIGVPASLSQTFTLEFADLPGIVVRRGHIKVDNGGNPSPLNIGKLLYNHILACPAIRARLADIHVESDRAFAKFAKDPNPPTCPAWIENVSPSEPPSTRSEPPRAHSAPL